MISLRFLLPLAIIFIYNIAESEPLECGKGKSVTESSISNLVKLGEFPWLVTVLLFDRSEKEWQRRCQGSLINPKVVLTSAACAGKIRAKNLKVKTGVLNVTDIKAHANQVHQESQVVSITKHPHYVEKDIPENDIALLFLKEPLKITKNLNTICLPKSSINYKQICYVLSWQGNGKDSIILVDLPLIDRDTCSKMLTKYWHKDTTIDKNAFCAGGQEGKDSCTGDSGAPLFCQNANTKKYEQIGIVSWGIQKCGTPEAPSSYTDVTKFSDWISSVMKQKKIN